MTTLLAKIKSFFVGLFGIKKEEPVDTRLPINVILLPTSQLQVELLYQITDEGDWSKYTITMPALMVTKMNVVDALMTYVVKDRIPTGLTLSDFKPVLLTDEEKIKDIVKSLLEQKGASNGR